MRRTLGFTLAATSIATMGCVGSPESLPGNTLPTPETLAPVVSPSSTIVDTVEPTVTSTISPETTSTLLELSVFNPDCVHVVVPGDSLSMIARNTGNDTESLQQHNVGIVDADTIYVGQFIDICVNEVNDIDGTQIIPVETVPMTTVTLAPETTIVETTVPPEEIPSETSVPPDSTMPPETTTTIVAENLPVETGVEAQQRKLNELLSPYGMPELEIDGISGPFTERALCAARVVLNLEISRESIVPGTPEEITLLNASGVQIPGSAGTHANRWGIIDTTCQIQVHGESSERVVHIFPTSTGRPEYPTRTSVGGGQNAHRFNPALENDGWHNSSDYPADDDNPLNGNMYKPIYFDRGQAIHGANNVPLSPGSFGCARLSPANQDRLVSWLGLETQQKETWDSNLISFFVTVQGQY